MSWKWKYASVLTAVSLTMCAPIFGPTGTTGGTGGFGDSWTIQSLSADSATSSAAAYTTMTDLSISVAASTNYQIRCVLYDETPNTITGNQLSIDGPAATEVLIDRHFCNGAAPSNTAFAATNAFYGAATDDGSSGGAGANSPCANIINIMLRNGGSSGTVTFKHQSETGGSTVTFHQGSFCEYRTF